MVNWILEEGVFGSPITPLVTEIQAQGHRVRVIDYTRGFTDYERFFPEDSCILFYGSLHVAMQILSNKTRRELLWIPGIIGTLHNYHCTHYYSYLEKWLLNDRYCILPVEDLSRRVALAEDSVMENLMGDGNRLFVRPDSPLKPFSGSVYSRKELADLQGFMRRHYLDSPEMLVVIAKEKEIEAEWRVVIVEGQVLSSSQYKQSGKPYYQQGMPDEVQRVAEEVAECGWQPDPIWILDLCWSKGNAYILEINFLSCSSLYKCDSSLIVKEASRIAQEEWNNVHSLGNSK